MLSNFIKYFLMLKQYLETDFTKKIPTKFKFKFYF